MSVHSDPRLRPIQIIPPLAKPRLIERIKQEGIFVLYGAVCLGALLVILSGLLVPSN
jgi:hypothetical protein